jgi:hypothetical protein
LYRSTVFVYREDVIALVGEIDADVVDKIVATGATLEEIAMALAAAETAVGFDEPRPLAWAPRIAAVRGLLEPQLIARENIVRGRD